MRGTLIQDLSRSAYKPVVHLRNVFGLSRQSHDYDNKKPNSSLLKMFLKYNIYIITLEGEKCIIMNI